MIHKLIIFSCLLFISSCAKAQIAVPSVTPRGESVKKISNDARVIHVMVALCDNEFQAIVPVPAHLGNGEDTAKNLYWGAMYGVKTYFGKSPNWTKIATNANPKYNVLERIIFKHKTQNVYLIADAYRGSKMKETINDFFSAITGETLENIAIDGKEVQTMGSANLVAFVGHDGLMDFKLTKKIEKKDEDKRDAIILACASRNYFAEHLKMTNARPLLWTSNLMAPEAYILHDALEGWIKNETPEQVQIRGAAAYAKFQRISVRSAERLLVTGY